MHPRPGGIVERDAQGGAEVAAEVAVPIFIGRGEQRHQHDERVAVDEGEAGFARPGEGGADGAVQRREVGGLMAR